MAGTFRHIRHMLLEGTRHASDSMRQLFVLSPTRSTPPLPKAHPSTVAKSLSTTPWPTAATTRVTRLLYRVVLHACMKYDTLEFLTQEWRSVL